MIRPICYLAALFVSVGAFANTAIYTNGFHPVSAISPDIPVIYLDAPDSVQREIFGSLPVDPAQAERQVRELQASSAFKTLEQQLVAAYQGVINAWSLGLIKYPAVVFGDKWVVYGTTDVGVAAQQLINWQQESQ
ncbi:TIGR03757 family integrating conjugative element protein [Yersinia aldovae]|uniref:Integrating conjugative element protein, PFL_4709 family n=1 Tax=Yersinia aldovae TaxID=29483 RepID=A0ABM9SZC9_YERAL|nr:TIGR03757 family integrating conjugative element protein [Yersinia aldovae]CNL86843.1 integrating conjugative element protein%2C PFL_4709 family [Yersinia aldovae]